MLREDSITNFGFLIAFIVPGFTALWGVSYFSDTVRLWLGESATESPTVGGFLYVTLASIAAGLTASAVRWMVINRLHQWTGIPEPRWDFSRLGPNAVAFNMLIEIHYRHYQYYANMLVALIFLFICRRMGSGQIWAPLGAMDWSVLGLAAIFYVTSRDTLRKYHTRGTRLLGGGHR